MEWRATGGESGGRLPAGARVEGSQGRRRLVFDRVTKADEGEFVCVAVNSAGRDEDKVMLFVSGGQCVFRGGVTTTANN